MSNRPCDADSTTNSPSLLHIDMHCTSESNFFSDWELMAELQNKLSDFSTLRALVLASSTVRRVYERFPRTAIATILKRYSPGVRRIATALVGRDEVILETWACQSGFESSYLTGSNKELPKTITDPIGTLMKLTAIFQGANDFARAIHVAQDAEISAGMISQRPNGIYEQSRLQDIISGTIAVPKGSICFIPCFNQEYQTSNPKDPTIMEYMDDAQRLYWNYVILQDMRSKRTRRCTSCGKRCVNKMYDTLTTSLLKHDPVLLQ